MTWAKWEARALTPIHINDLRSGTIEGALQISVDAIGFITLAKCVAKKWEIAERHILAVTITVGSVRGLSAVCAVKKSTPLTVGATRGEENFRTVVVARPCYGC